MSNDKKRIGQLTPATQPLSGDELIPIEQNGKTVNAPVSAIGGSDTSKFLVAINNYTGGSDSDLDSVSISVAQAAAGQLFQFRSTNDELETYQAVETQDPTSSPDLIRAANWTTDLTPYAFERITGALPNIIEVDYFKTSDQEGFTIPENAYGQKSGVPFFGDTPLDISQFDLFETVINLDGIGTPLMGDLASFAIPGSKMVAGATMKVQVDLAYVLDPADGSLYIGFDFSGGANNGSTGSYIQLVTNPLGPTVTCHMFGTFDITLGVDGANLQASLRTTTLPTTVASTAAGSGFNTAQVCRSYTPVLASGSGTPAADDVLKFRFLHTNAAATVSNAIYGFARLLE